MARLTLKVAHAGDLVQVREEARSGEQGCVAACSGRAVVLRSRLDWTSRHVSKTRIIDARNGVSLKGAQRRVYPLASP